MVAKDTNEIFTITKKGITPKKRIIYGGKAWTYVTISRASELRGYELALKLEGNYVYLVKFRDNPTAYFIYKRKAKGAEQYVKRDVMGNIVDW